MIGRRKILGERREFRESFEKKMNSEEMGELMEQCSKRAILKGIT